VWLVERRLNGQHSHAPAPRGLALLDEPVNRRKPAALRSLLETLPAAIATVMVIDPDIRIRGRNGGSSIDVERFISDFQLSGAQQRARAS